MVEKHSTADPGVTVPNPVAPLSFVKLFLLTVSILKKWFPSAVIGKLTR